MAEGIAINCTPALEFESLDSAQDILGALRAYEHIETAVIFDKKGNSVDYRRADLAASRCPPLSRQEGAYFEDGKLRIFKFVLREGKILGTVFIQSDMEELRDRLRQLRAGRWPSWCWARCWPPCSSPRGSRSSSRAHPPPGRGREPGLAREGLLPARGEGHRGRAGRAHRRLQRHARADPAARRRAHGGQGGGGAGQPHQERLPGQHEPRAAHAAQRHHRLQRDAAGGGAGHAASEDARPRPQEDPRARASTCSPSSTTSSTSRRSRPGKMELYLETFEVRALVRRRASHHPPADREERQRARGRLPARRRRPCTPT